MRFELVVLPLGAFVVGGQPLVQPLGWWSSVAAPSVKYHVLLAAIRTLICNVVDVARKGGALRMRRRCSCPSVSVSPSV